MPDTSSRSDRAAAAFSERPAWSAVGDGWRHLHGSIRGAGASFEWHDFRARSELDWGGSFHPGSVEICLNIAGHGRVGAGESAVEYSPLTAGFYRRGTGPLPGSRRAGERHQFLTVELSFDFLRQNLAETAGSLHPLVREVVAGPVAESAVAPVVRLGSRQQQLLASLRATPVSVAAQPLWYQAKALEIAAELFFDPAEVPELFCQRQHRLASERVARVIALLEQHLAEPLALEEIGRTVGVQSVSSEPHVLGVHGHDDSAIPASVAHGTGGGVIAVRAIQRHANGAGGGLFQPEPFQPGVS